MQKYLESHGVKVEYGIDVKNVVFEINGKKKTAKKIEYVKNGEKGSIDLMESDLVFITNGCCTDTSCYGDQTHAPDLSKIRKGGGESWDLWKNIAIQDPAFGNPSNYCDHPDETNWMSATVETSDDEIIKCSGQSYHGRNRYR